MDKSIKNVDFKNKQHKKWSPFLHKINEVFEGIQAIKDNAEVYVLKDTKETDTHYKNKINRLRFENYLASAINNIAGLIFKNNYSIKLPKILGDFEENADSDATALNHFIISHAKNTLKNGVGFIWIDYTNNDFSNMNEFLKSGAKPFFKSVNRDDVISYKTEIKNGRKTLTQVVIAQSRTVEVDDFEEVEEDIYVVLKIGEGSIYTKNLDGTFKQITSWSNKLKYIPFFASYASKTGFFESEIPFLDLMELNLSLLNVQSDDTMLRARASRPIVSVFGYGIGDDYNEEEDDDEVVWGEGAKDKTIVLGLEDSLDFGDREKTNSGVVITSIPAEIIKVNEDSIAELKTSIDKFSMSILSNQTFKTATEALIKDENSSLFLVEIVTSIESTVRKSIQACLDFVENNEDFEFRMSKVFKNTAISADDIDKYIKLKNEGIVSANAVFDILKEGKIISDELDYKKEQALIQTESEALDFEV